MQDVKVLLEVLQASVQLNGVCRDGTKFPKMFCVKVPMLKKDGSLHKEKWKSIYNERKTMAAVSAESSEESNVVVKRGGRSV